MTESAQIDQHKERRTFAIDVLVRLLTQSILYLRTLIFLPLIAKTMGATQYGIWTQITVTLTLLAPILMLRLEIASVRYLSSKTGQDASRDFFPMLLLVFAIVIGVGGIAYFFNDSLALFLFNDASQTYFVNLFLLILIARTLFQFSINFYRVSKQMKKYSLIELLTAFFEIGGAVYLVLNGVGLEGVLLPFIVVEFFAVILILADIIRQIGLPDKIQISRTFRYIRYSAPLIVNRFENWIVESGDRYLITHILSVAQAGIYSASYVIGQLAVFFLWPITFVLFPTITKLWEEKKYDEVTRYMQDSLRYFLLLSVPCVVGIYYLSPELLTLLTTDEFTKDRTLVLFITLGIFCLGVSQIYIYVLHLKEKTRNMALLFIGAAIANITLNLILIPEMGIRGAAIATFIAYLVRLAFVMGYSAKLHWIGFDLVFFFKALAASLGMYIVLTFISPESLLALLGAIGAGAISYILIMVLLKAIGIAELKAIRGLIQPKKASQS